MARLGSIYRRKKRQGGKLVELPTWWITYYHHGRRIRESAKTTDYQRAARLLKVRQGQAATSRLVFADRLTFSDLAEDMKQDYRDNKRPTLLQLESRLENHILPELGRYRAADITTAQIEQYKRKRAREEAKPATINRELEIIRRAFRLAADCERIERVPKVRLLHVDNTRTGFLEYAQYVTLRNLLMGPYQLLLVVGYHTGLRLGELRRLQWDQVDLASKRIMLHPGTTKNKEARTVPIYGEMTQFLEMALAEMEATFPDCHWVFQKHGEHVGEFRATWAKATKAAGLQGLLFHDLRRSAVRNMVRAGITQAVAMAISGHKTTSMFRRYNITSERDLEEAATKLDEYQQAQAEKAKAKQQIAQQPANDLIN